MPNPEMRKAIQELADVSNRLYTHFNQREAVDVILLSKAETLVQKITRLTYGTR